MSAFKNWIRRMLTLPEKNLVGKDLQGNTFIEISRGGGSMPKRIVQYAGPTRYLSEYSSNRDLSPQWAAWLSYTRGPPSLEELRIDQARYMRIQQIVQAKKIEETQAIKSPTSDFQHATKVMHETPLSAFLPVSPGTQSKPTSSNQAGDNGWQPDSAKIVSVSRKAAKFPN